MKCHQQTYFRIFGFFKSVAFGCAFPPNLLTDTEFWMLELYVLFDMAVFCSQVAPDPALEKPPSCGPSCIGGSTGGHTWSSGHQSYFNHITTWGYDDICKHGDMTICTFRSLNGHHVKRAQGNIKVWWFSVMLLLVKKMHSLTLQNFDIFNSACWHHIWTQ